MKLALALLAALAACGDNTHAGGSGGADAAIASCSASFSGEFTATSRSESDCPVLAGDALDFAIPIAAIGSALAIEIDLPAAAPGSYSSETVASWSGSAFEAQTNGGCLFRAGNAATPQGSFQLALTSVAPLHGALMMSLAVLTFPGSVCGQIDTEAVTATF